MSAELWFIFHNAHSVLYFSGKMARFCRVGEMALIQLKSMRDPHLLMKLYARKLVQQNFVCANLTIDKVHMVSFDLDYMDISSSVNM